MDNSKCIPNLIIPGFPKSGTSSLFDYLCQHPEVYHPKVKEPHTYAIDNRYKNRHSKKGDFNVLYPLAKGYKYIPDASTIYMLSENALKRINKEKIQNLKIIIIARDPIERIFSHYNWLRMLGYKQLDFKDEILKYHNIPFDAEKNIKGNYKNYLQFSNYGEQFGRCYDIFDKNQVFVLSLESLIGDFENTINNIFKFLELDFFEISKPIINKTPDFKTQRRISIPSKLKVLEKKINTNIVSNSRLFLKKIKPLKFTIKDEKFIFKLISSDIEILKKFNLVLPEWKTVNKYF